MRLTFRNENINVSGFGVCSLTRVISTVGVNDVMYSQPAGTTAAILSVYNNASSIVIIVDHFFVVIPEHVLRGLWTLETKITIPINQFRIRRPRIERTVIKMYIATAGNL